MGGIDTETVSVKIETDGLEEEWPDEETVETMDTQYHSTGDNQVEKQSEVKDEPDNVKPTIKVENDDESSGEEIQEEDDDVQEQEEEAAVIEEQEEEAAVKDEKVVDEEDLVNYHHQRETKLQMKIPPHLLLDKDNKLVRKRSAPSSSSSSNLPSTSKSTPKPTSSSTSKSTARSKLSSYITSELYFVQKQKLEACKAEKELKLKLKLLKKGKNSKKKHYCYFCPPNTPPFDSYDILNKHKKYHHAHDRLPCLFCPEKFGDSQQEKAHLRTHAESERPYSCRLCPPVPDKDNPSQEHFKLFYNLADWFLHMDGHRKEQREKARAAVDQVWNHGCTHPGCSKNFQSTAAIKAHLKTHDKPFFYCTAPHCDRVFKAELHLQQHVKAAHVKKEKKEKDKVKTEGLKCPVPNCTEEFEEGDQESYDEHVEYHLSPTFGFTCPHCPCRFRFEYMLNRHLLTHTELPFRCTFMETPRHLGHFEPKCGMGFKTREELLRHTKEAHNEKRKNYQCPFCGDESFTQGSQLRRHQTKCQKRVNTPGVASNLMNMCPIPKCRFFFFGEAMDQHLREHISAAKIEEEDEEGFACMVCDEVCPSEKGLVEHLQGEHFERLGLACKATFSNLMK